MKRNIKLLASLLVLAIAGTGCNGTFDDLAVNPNQPSMTSFFSDPEGVNSAVMTCYGYLTTQRCLGASGSNLVVIRSDEASSNSDYGKVGNYGSSLNSSFYTITQPYALMYSVASQACYIIENIDNVTFTDETLKKAYKGEAYFMRAFAHYYLLVNYRKIAPFYHMPTSSADYVREQEAPAKVWDFICSDLKEAKQLLPKKDYWSSTNKGRVTAGSAAALLGKCYLYRSGIESLYGEDKTTYYDEAAAEFDEIIKGTYGKYSLVSDYSWNFDVAHENNDEALFELQFLGDVNNATFNPGTSTSGLANDPRGIMLPGTGVGYEGVVHDWLYNEFVKSIDKDGYTDIRMFSCMLFNDLAPEIKLRPGQRLTGPGGYHFEDYYPNKDFSTCGNVRTHKYHVAFKKGMDMSMPMRDNVPTKITGVGAGTKEYIYNQPRAHGVNWRYIRYADVLLMYAECLVKGGKVGSMSAAEAYNLVRDRANMSRKGAISMDDIKQERMLEFALEGIRFYDLLRWGDLADRFHELEKADPNFKQFEADGDYTGFIDGKHQWLPIPIDEIQSNSKATQNWGY